jgi:O-methyltransferase involved in polyketide biosynthesis
MNVDDLANEMRTLLIPLRGRAAAAREGSRILTDAKAAQIADELGIDLSARARRSHAATDLIHMARARVLDDFIRDYVSKHPRATVVNLGAGLDTAFYRVDNGLITWIDVDQGPVIELRRRLLPETERSRTISTSLEDSDWLNEIPPAHDGMFIFAAGMLIYLREAQAARLLDSLAARFPRSQIAFDMQSAMGVFLGNFALRRAGMGEARLRWGASGGRRISRWSGLFAEVECFPLFSSIRAGQFSSRWDWTVARMMDRFRAISIVRLTSTPAG